MSRSLLLLLTTGCAGVLLIDDPRDPVADVPIDPPVEVVTEMPDESIDPPRLTLDLAFLAGDVLGGCELNDDGPVWVVVTDPFGDERAFPTACADTITVEVDPQPEASVVVRTLPPGDDGLRPAFPIGGSVWFASEPVMVALQPETDTRLGVRLDCQNCDFRSLLEVEPVFLTAMGAGGCDLNPSGELTLTWSPYSDLHPPIERTMPCDEPTVFEIPASHAAGGGMVQLTSAPSVWDTFEPVVWPYFQSAFVDVPAIPPGTTTSLTMVLECDDDVGVGCPP
jgi:hypothetical protein